MIRFGVKVLVIVFLFLSAQSSHAQGLIQVDPPGGLTINTLMVTDSGWVFARFNETPSGITSNCDNASNYGISQVGIWIAPETVAYDIDFNPNAGGSLNESAEVGINQDVPGKSQLYSFLLALYFADRPLIGLTLIDIGGNYCVLHAVKAG